MPVTGGAKTPARLLRTAAGRAATPTSPLDKHLLRLLTLHKNMPARFRSIDLPKMDDVAKRALLADIQDLLNIR
jgi:hypothetical protein